MRLTICVLFSAIASLATSAALADAAQPAPQSTAAVQPASTTSDDGKLICRHRIHEGMVLSSEECHTLHQWEAIRRNTDREINEYQIRNLQEQPH
jgi:hypothetical protein